ncbi:hypothetical protein AUR04nite_10060 [Glutamicibacter uratoxydans]|uniref:HTH tetR-type domain-containing protein n=1 Tax=Glutamicibacter uratoxydans TaxID=43667 RepID=A0A4Y4DNL1_GLUUR|nr:TetR family transcriptional regulator [Glutamicibacter uratoxydans]GED05474.1 hypothetical protein AUR04nite_10060 [Glutamicibacter uratoxydans]
MGIREQRKAATRGQIQRAALDLAERDGLEHVTISQIAAQAGIADRTFFRYCESKESAIFPKHDALFEAIAGCRLLPHADGSQIFEQLLAACREVFVCEVKTTEFRRVSQLILSEPKLAAFAKQEEQWLVEIVQKHLDGHGIDSMQSLLIGELVATTWRAAWQRFAIEDQPGQEADPVALYDQAIATLGLLCAGLSE